jgi:single-strand DNA-binding protein
MNRKFRTQSGEDREEVTFIDCAAFGKTGEVIGKYFTKGKPIFIEGRIKYDSWEDKQGGGKRSKITVVVENFQFVGGRDGGGGGGGGGGGDHEVDYSNEAPAPRSAPPQRGGAPSSRGMGAPRPQQSAPQQAEPPFGDEQKFTDDEIPF